MHNFKKKMVLYILLSLMAHLLVFFPLARYGRYYFAKPVDLLQAVTVELPAVEDKPAAPAKVTPKNSPPGEKPASSTSKAVHLEAPHVKLNPSGTAGMPEADTAPAAPRPGVEAAKPVDQKQAAKPVTARVRPLQELPPPLRTAGEFTTTKREQLNYQISLLGMPIGKAVLEAKNEKGEVRITLKVKSAPAISSIYPVDDTIETRHIAGNFIITKIKQQEGSFRSDRGFTIFLRDKSVFWIDLLRNRSIKESIPNDQVLDLLSAFYYLRNRPLEVGETELLDVYDSDRYSPVPVEILRRERVGLPGFRQAETIVVKPNLKTDGIFKRTGELTIWLTDDDKKVPVRLETTIPLGKITVELVSAEAEPVDPPSTAHPIPLP